MVKDIQAIPDDKLRESLRINICALLDLIFSQYADCFELIKEFDDLLSDISLSTSMTAFELECRLREISGPLLEKDEETDERL